MREGGDLEGMRAILLLLSRPQPRQNVAAAASDFRIDQAKYRCGNRM